MRHLAPLIVLLLAGCQDTASVRTQNHTHGFALTDSQREQLERKASNGDASAAWRLYDYHAIERHQETAAEPWLLRAAELDHPQAQRSLAYRIKVLNQSPPQFGTNAPQAVKHLLERAARTEGSACNELASAHAEGYFGSPDFTTARFYFERGATFHHRICWEKLSGYLRNGIGGPRDDAKAYYWISLEAHCVDPRSVSGKETWERREEIASHLSSTTLQQEWKRIDAYMADVAAAKIRVDSAPFLSGMIDPKLEAEGRRHAQERENEHRRKHQP